MRELPDGCNFMVCIADQQWEKAFTAWLVQETCLECSRPKNKNNANCINQMQPFPSESPHWKVWSRENAENVSMFFL